MKKSANLDLAVVRSERTEHGLEVGAARGEHGSVRRILRRVDVERDVTELPSDRLEKRLHVALQCVTCSRSTLCVLLVYTHCVSNNVIHSTSKRIYYRSGL